MTLATPGASNIQIIPTPNLYEAATAPASEPQGVAILTDEYGNPITDENGNPILL